MIAEMAGQPTTRILDGLRSLERKTGLVFTFFKASVYAMVVSSCLRSVVIWQMNKGEDDEEVLKEMELNGKLGQ